METKKFRAVKIGEVYLVKVQFERWDTWAVVSPTHSVVVEYDDQAADAFNILVSAIEESIGSKIETVEVEAEVEERDGAVVLRWGNYELELEETPVKVGL